MNKYLKYTEVELKLNGYSGRTLSTYLNCVKEYLSFKNENYAQLDIFNIKEFIAGKYDQEKSGQTINLYLNAIKFFYREVIGIKEEVKIKFAKKSKKPAIILTRQELEQIFLQIKNDKHRLIMQLSYGSGLRISEVLNIKIKDINLESNILIIPGIKNLEDRQTIIPNNLENQIQNQINSKQENDYLFISRLGGKLSERGLQKVFSLALKNTSIKKEATFHSLRHSFAVHLFEKGIDAKHIQKILGHKNLRTTQIYKKLAKFNLKNLPSPY